MANRNQRITKSEIIALVGVLLCIIATGVIAAL